MNKKIAVVTGGAGFIGSHLANALLENGYEVKIVDNLFTITGDGTQTRDFTHVRDVVRANMLAAESKQVGKGEVINIGAGSNASVLEVAELIGGPFEHIAPRLEPHDTLADYTKAKELLGWEPQVSLEEGIAELKRSMHIQ